MKNAIKNILGVALVFSLTLLLNFILQLDIFTTSGLGLAAMLGFTKVCGDKSAGLYKINIATVDDVTSFTISSGVYNAVTMNGSAVFLPYGFKQDEAKMIVNTVRNNGSKKTTIDIEFYLDKMTKEASETIEDLADQSNCGFIVIATDNNGYQWVVGYSEAHKKVRPAEFISAEGDTGSLLDDPNGNKIVLRAVSKTRPLKFTGTIPN